jgi:magnesium chelatase family protein
MLARCLSASLHGLEANGLTLWERVIEQRRLTTRSSLQLLRVAHTIADASGFSCMDLVGDHSAGAESR